mgnify:CR=1 FL=1
MEESNDNGEGMAKDYHVCETSEQFFENDFNINQDVPED